MSRKRAKEPVTLDEDKLIRKLRLELRLERAAIALIAIILFGRWAYGHLESRPYAILADGTPVACVATAESARAVLDQVRGAVAGTKPEDISFAQKVEIRRADRGAQVADEHEAIKAVLGKLSLRVNKWAILVDGVPAAAVESKTSAGKLLERAKEKFGSLAKHLMEEPQFKEQVEVQEMPVDPALFRTDEDEALDLLLSSSAGSGIYVVKSGDVAVNIAARLGLTLEELEEFNPTRNLHRLQIGDKLRVSNRAGRSKPRLTVIVRDQETRTEVLPYRTESVSSVRMRAGKQVELSPGTNGLRRVVVAATYENDVRTGSEILEETIIRDPVPRRIAIGIRPR